jgi:hypothetical protein
MMVGRWDEAMSRGQEVAGTEELSSLLYVAGSLLHPLVSLYVHRGELRQARAALQSMQALSTSENFDDRSIYLLTEALLLRVEGHPAEALVRAQQVVEGRVRLGLTDISVKLGLIAAVEAALDLADTATADELLGIVRAARPGGGHSVPTGSRREARRPPCRAAE